MPVFCLLEGYIFLSFVAFGINGDILSWGVSSFQFYSGVFLICLYFVYRLPNIPFVFLLWLLFEQVQ